MVAGGCYLSTSCFRGVPLAEAVARASQLADGRVELSAPHPHIGLVELEEMLNTWRRNGILLTMHNYFPPPSEDFVLNIASACTGTRERCERMLDGILTLAGASGSPVYGVHAGYLFQGRSPTSGQMFEFSRGRSSYTDAMARATASISDWAPLFASQGIRLLVENLFPFPDDDHSLCCTPDQIAQFLSAVPASVGLLLDLGHFNISATLMAFNREAGLEELLTAFGHRLFQVHLSHNDGLHDEHLVVEEGGWQLDAVARLKAIPLHDEEERLFSLEARNSPVSEIEKSLQSVNRVLSA